LVACGPLRLDDLARRKGGGADVADLALVHQVGKPAERLLDVGVRIEAVDLVKVDPIRAQPPQRIFNRLADSPTRRPAAVTVIVENLKFIGKESPWETSTPNPGGDQFNPSIAFDASNGFLTACWYDTGEDAPNLVKTRYTCATSPNLAGGWSPTQDIATVPSDASGTGRGTSSLQYGFHTGVVASNGTIHAEWMDTRDFGAGLGGWDIYTQAFKCAGKWNPKGHWDC
jgi:hypothetical protein